MTMFDRSDETPSLPMELPSISSARASRARTSAMPDAGLDLPVNALAYSTKSPVLLANWSQQECCWKTSQHSLLGGLETFSEPWPRSGMMLSGIAYQLPPLAHRIDGTESGYWPTPTASGFEVADVDALLARRARMKEKHGNGNGFGLTLNQAVRVWPTPTSRDWKDGSAPRFRGGVLQLDTLGRAVGGQLNPPWVEWLMGFPDGWTDLSGSETP